MTFLQKRVEEDDVIIEVSIKKDRALKKEKREKQTDEEKELRKEKKLIKKRVRKMSKIVHKLQILMFVNEFIFGRFSRSMKFFKMSFYSLLSIMLTS